MLSFVYSSCLPTHVTLDDKVRGIPIVLVTSVSCSNYRDHRVSYAYLPQDTYISSYQISKSGEAKTAKCNMVTIGMCHEINPDTRWLQQRLLQPDH